MIELILDAVSFDKELGVGDAVMPRIAVIWLGSVTPPLALLNGSE